MRTTLILSDAAYEVARSVSRSENRSMGEVVSDLILQPKASGKGLSGPNKLGFLTFAVPEALTVERVKQLLDDE